MRLLRRAQQARRTARSHANHGVLFSNHGMPSSNHGMLFSPLQMGYTDVPAVTESTLLDLFLLAHADYLVAGNVTVT